MNYGGRSQIASLPTALRITTYVSDSISNPNASCPVCGERVFFYQNSHGSRVFFDHPGPPWPKHPCTDNFVANPKTVKARTTSDKPTIQNVSDGWITLTFKRVKTEDAWHVLYFETVDENTFLRILVTERLEISKALPTYMRPWNSKGYTNLEFLDPTLNPATAVGWKYSEWCFSEPDEAERLRAISET